MDTPIVVSRGKKAIIFLFIYFILLACTKTGYLSIVSKRGIENEYVTIGINDTPILKDKKLNMDWSTGVSNINIEIKERNPRLNACFTGKPSFGTEQNRTVCIDTLLNLKRGKYLKLESYKDSVAIYQWNKTKIID